MIEVRGELAGMLLVYEEELDDFRHASLDIAMAHRAPGPGPRARGAARGRPPPDRRARPPPLHDRPGDRERARDPRLREARLQAGRRDAQLRARRRRHAGTTRCSWTCSPASSCSVRPPMDWDAEGAARGARRRGAAGPHRAARVPPGRGLHGRRAQAGGRGGPARAAARGAAARRRQGLQPAPDRARRPGSSSISSASSAARSGSPSRTPTPRCSATTDLEGAKDTAAIVEAGFSTEETLEVTRVLGRGMARFAEALRALFAQTFLEPGDSELELARRLQGSAEELLPLSSRLLDHVFLLHLQQLLRNDVLGIAERTSGKVSDTTETAVAFADLVGFTELGETVDVEELGGLASRLAKLAGEVVEQPVRVVKQIGDAVMLVSPDAEAIVGTCLDADRARGRRGRLPAAARRRLLRPGGQPLGRLVRLDGQRRQPPHRPRPPERRARLRGGQAAGRRRRVRVVGGGREEAQGPQQAPEHLPPPQTLNQGSALLEVDVPRHAGTRPRRPRR